jgi:putative ABC transport system permease protein
MSTALRVRPTDGQTGDGASGGAARRAVIRWAWRLFRREWRQQLLVLALLTLAVVATTVGVAMAVNVPPSDKSTLGTANHLITVSGSASNLAADVAAAQQWFGTVDVIAHQQVAIPGSVATLDVRDQSPGATYGQPMLRLDAGRYPSGSNEVAVTDGVAATFNLHIGDGFDQAGHAQTVVGIVENPANLLDEFALVAPGQAEPPDRISLLIDAPDAKFDAFRFPRGTGLDVEIGNTDEQQAAAIGVLVLATIGLIFIGLVAVAAFNVMAQRRLRALGMLGAIGATDRHIRLVMLANGAVVGIVAAVTGTAVGLTGWMALAPRLESIAEHRIDRFNLAWWALGAAMVLTVITAVTAAWWPARSAARMPVVAALSGRPPRPQPAHRFAAVGGVLLAGGLACLAFSERKSAVLIVTGIVATTLGVLSVAPLGIRRLAAAAGHAPIATRLALRDLARYQARSGAALGAVTLAVGLAAVVAISAAASQAGDTTGGNLPSDQLLLYLASKGPGGPIAKQAQSQLQDVEARVRDLATSVHAGEIVALEAAVNPNALELRGPNGQAGLLPAGIVKRTPAGDGFNEDLIAPLYVATPELLAHYGIPLGLVDPTVDVITSRTDLGGLLLRFGPRQPVQPKIQIVDLPLYRSAPNTLITAHAVEALGLQTVPAAWLIETPEPLTTTQIDAARRMAAATGLSVEVRSEGQELSPLRSWATIAGVLGALGVLAMTVGLIRSETATELRTLTATGASGNTRRTLTGATAGALALLGAVLGAAGAYLALAAWHRSDLHRLTAIPVGSLVVLLLGLPLAATVGGWLLGGREPPAIARQPLE